MGPRGGARCAARCEADGLEYEVNPGDGAFYGPKIDLHMTDSIGRSWQLGTVQLDYSMPERFDLAYTGADNAEHRPVMIHRALLGSFERFIGILLEHYAGELPLWLAPVQAIVLTVSDRVGEYAAEVARRLRGAGDPRRARRARRVDRAQDPRGGAAQDPVHARDRRRARRRSGRSPCASIGAGTPARSRSRSSSSACSALARAHSTSPPQRASSSRRMHRTRLDTAC